MVITDIFIKRPVLATVVSLMILVLGLRSMMLLPIRQFPYTQNAVVTVTTVYTGADPSVIAGFITTPLEASIAQANGIDYMTSTSNASTSVIQANLLLNYDSNKALSEINTKVNAVINQLPRDALAPVITVTIGETIDSMYIGFYSEVLPSNKITDYLIRVVQPKLQAVQGVQLAEIIGGRTFALRAWLDPEKMAGFKIGANDVAQALAANDFISAVGRTDGQMVTVNLSANTDLHTVEEFRELIIKSSDGAIVRLKDIAVVTLGSDSYDTAVKFDANQAVYIGIKVAPTANLLTTIDNVRSVFPSIVEQLPEGLDGRIVYDASKFVYSSIHEVEQSLFEAVAIVTLVIFLFLGSMRSVLIPLIAIPLSLIGVFFMMLLLGYSINLLTLLALVLAIGLVVDDAIIVVENIHRHMEEGMPRMKAAILGARELANPIIAISIVLIAVYVPIGFMSGLTGALFTEFAFTLAGTVGVSAIVALTLSPMMCSRLLTPSVIHHNSINGQPPKDPGSSNSSNPPNAENPPNSPNPPDPAIEDQSNAHKETFVQMIDRHFENLRIRYENILHRTLNHLPVVLVFSIIILFSIYFLYLFSEKELAPDEDQGILISLLTAAPNANLEQTQLSSNKVNKIFSSYPETDHVFQLDGVSGLNTAIIGMVMKPWDERKRTSMSIMSKVQNEVNEVSGVKGVVFPKPPLPGSSGLPIQFVIGTTGDFRALNEIADRLLEKALNSGLFIYIDKDLKIDKQQAKIVIDRDNAALLGFNMQQIGNLLASSVGGSYINYFDLQGRSYKVIPQVLRAERINYDQLLNYYIKTPSGVPIPLSTFAKIETSVVPETINHFQQLNSATISGVAMPGITQGRAIEALQQFAKEVLPQDYSIDYAQQSRQYIQEGSALILTFIFALIIITLTLAALFESFKDPLIVMISVPMSICGAMIFICLGVGGASLNIYTQVGLVTLIGLISKHGILIVQFANDLQKEGYDKRKAVELAASIRLRPILMTTASMVLGVIPLITASGAGAVSRFNIGLVIATGISIGTLFTLFVVPAMYVMLADVLEKEPSVSKQEGGDKQGQEVLV